MERDACPVSNFLYTHTHTHTHTQSLDLDMSCTCWFCDVKQSPDSTLQVFQFPSRVYLECLSHGDIVAHQGELALHDERIFLCCLPVGLKSSSTKGLPFIGHIYIHFGMAKSAQNIQDQNKTPSPSCVSVTPQFVRGSHELRTSDRR